MDASEAEVELLAKGAVDVIDGKDLRAKLGRSRASGKPLTVKVGFDPSAPDIHLGHTVLLRKMRQFQNAGHRVVFLIGDFTGLIGDPSGKKTTRPQLTRAQIEANAQTYAAQCFKVLDEQKTEIRYNSEWFLGGGPDNFPPLGADGWIKLASKITVARILERDDFQKRWQAHQPISLHELLYPLSQGFDSVALKADVELGGTDQLFNLLIGRDLMREEGLEPQVVMTLPLLVGTDGVEKMSKSLGNAIGVNDPPGEIFGKIMSIPDETMWNYWTLLTDLLPSHIGAMKSGVADGSNHPMEIKKELAERIVEDFHGPVSARDAREEFERVFSRRERPTEDQYQPIELPAGPGEEALTRILVEAKFAPSNREARRLIETGSVEINEVPVTNPAHSVYRTKGGFRLRVGKRRFALIDFV